MTVGAERMADLCEQKPREVGNLSRGPDRRAGGADGVFLFDRNGGADVDQPVDIRPATLSRNMRA